MCYVYKKKTTKKKNNSFRGIMKYTAQWFFFFFITSYCLKLSFFFFFPKGKVLEHDIPVASLTCILCHLFCFSFFALSTPDTENCWYQIIARVEEGLWHGNLSPAVFFWCCMRASAMWCWAARWAGEEEGVLCRGKCLYLRERELVARSWKRRAASGSVCQVGEVAAC